MLVNICWECDKCQGKKKNLQREAKTIFEKCSKGCLEEGQHSITGRGPAGRGWHPGHNSALIPGPLFPSEEDGLAWLCWSLFHLRSPSRKGTGLFRASGGGVEDTGGYLSYTQRNHRRWMSSRQTLGSEVKGEPATRRPQPGTQGRGPCTWPLLSWLRDASVWVQRLLAWPVISLKICEFTSIRLCSKGFQNLQNVLWRKPGKHSFQQALWMRPLPCDSSTPAPDSTWAVIEVSGKPTPTPQPEICLGKSCAPGWMLKFSHLKNNCLLV